MRNTAYIKISLIIIIAAAALWFIIRFILSLPTHEEKVLLALMKEFKHGNYKAASEYCAGNSFFQVIDKSRVVDTDGQEIDWHSGGFDWTEAAVQASVETYVKLHLRRMEFKQLSTQRLKDGAEAVVHFYAELDVADYQEGNILAPAIHKGSVEGNCFMVRDSSGEIKVEHFDVTLISFEGFDLKRYLRDM